MNDVPHDPFERSNYRQLFAWSKRLQREWPFLRRTLAETPSRRLLDLGSGSGEHAAFLQEQGFDVTGVDASAEQVRAASDHERPDGPRFVHGRIAELGRVAPGPFGAALCLGNVLPYLHGEELEDSIRALARALEPGALVITQMVNYPGLRQREVRHLPVNVRPGEEEGEEIVFLRLLRHRDERWTDFVPVTLRWGSRQEEPVSLDWSRVIRLRAWTQEEMASILERHGLELLRTHGGMQGEDFDPVESHDIVLLARRR